MNASPSEPIKTKPQYTHGKLSSNPDEASSVARLHMKSEDRHLYSRCHAVPLR